MPYSVDFHMVIRQNGQYFGLFTFVEDTDDQFLMVSVLLQQQQGQYASSLPCPARLIKPSFDLPKVEVFKLTIACDVHVSSHVKFQRLLR